MDKVILIIGPSGSGKTTLAKELNRKYNLIDSYTTRKPRGEDDEGHIFLNYLSYKVEKNYQDTKIKIEIINGEGKVDTYIAEAFMDSYGDLYFITKKQYKGKGTSIYVVDPEGAEMVYENVKDASVLAIFLTCDMEERKYRMLERGDSHSEIKSRLKKDEQIFSRCKCDFVVDGNKQFKQVLKDVEYIIENKRI